MPCRSVRGVGGDYSQPHGKEDLISLIDNAEGDNGWCLALVEPDGERTLCRSAAWKISGIASGWRD